MPRCRTKHSVAFSVVRRLADALTTVEVHVAQAMPQPVW